MMFAEAHGVTSAQVILRWDLQRGIVVIPGSSNPEHIKENLDLFDFELTDEEMEQMTDLWLNENEKSGEVVVLPLRSIFLIFLVFYI